MRARDFVEKWLQAHNDEEMAPHLLLVGRTGSGKTTAAKYVVSRALSEYSEIVVLDWDNEYNNVLSTSYDPPFTLYIPQPMVVPLVTDAITEVERSEGGGHAIAHFLRKALEEAAREPANIFLRAAERLRTRALEIASYALRGALDAALMRLEEIAPYATIETTPTYALGLRRGTYKLFKIPSIWSRAALRQFLAIYHVVARRAQAAAYEEEPANFDPPDPSILVIEEGSVGATTTYLVHLLTEARKALTRIIMATQRLPDADIVQNCELLLFDTSPAVRRTLHAAIPDSRLRVGEAWWVRRDGEAKRISFRD